MKAWLAGWLRSLHQGLTEEWTILFGGHARMERSGVLTVLLVIPLLYPTVVAYLYHAEDAQERPALLLDLDGSALSRRLTLDLEAAPELRFVGRTASLDEGQAALGRGEAELLVIIPDDLSRKVKRGERAQVAFWSPGGNVYTWSLAFTAASNVVATENAALAAGRFMRMGMPPAVARSRAAPIATGERRLFHPSAGYGRYLAVGVLLVVLQQLVLISLAFSAGVRRERGVPVGAPPHPLAHVSGMSLAHLPFWLGGAAFIGLVILPWMGWAGPSVLATSALLFLFVAVMGPMAVIMASLVPDRMSAFQILMFLSVPLFVASGFTWPAAQLPRAVELLTYAFPVTPALRAMRILSMKSGDLRAVLPELAWMVGLGLGHAALATFLVLRLVRRHGRRHARLATAVPGISP